VALWVHDFLRHLGYKKTGVMEVYWLLPSKELNDGLRIVDYVDNIDLDDNAITNTPQLPKVITPRKQN
jgi:hypothetical protein